MLIVATIVIAILLLHIIGFLVEVQANQQEILKTLKEKQKCNKN